MRLHKGRQFVDVSDTDSQLIRYYRRDGWSEVTDEPPAESARKAEWVDYAEQHGDANAADETKAELIAEFSEPD